MLKQFQIANGRKLRGLAAMTAVGVAMTVATAGFAEAADPDLSGAWSGGGSVSFATGNREKARCRANFSKAGGAGYSMSATCATASGKVSQAASLTKTGANSYSGNFHNSEYNVSGTIRIRVNGSSQSVSLTSDSGSASFSLRKL